MTRLYEWRPGCFCREGESVAVDGMLWLYGCTTGWVPYDLTRTHAVPPELSNPKLPPLPGELPTVANAANGGWSW